MERVDTSLKTQVTCEQIFKIFDHHYGWTLCFCTDLYLSGFFSLPWVLVFPYSSILLLPKDRMMDPNESNELTREHQGGHHVQLSSTFWVLLLLIFCATDPPTHVDRMDPQQLESILNFQ